MLTSTITLYNYIKELNGRAQYNRWVIPGIVADYNKGRNRIASGDVNTDAATLYFMYRNVDLSKYKPYGEWQALSEANKLLYWTLDTLSIIALNEQTYEIKTQTIDNVTTTGTVAGLKAIAQVFQITSVDNRDRGSYFANHIEVGAR